MSLSYEVKCINKIDRDNPYERILFIGGTKNDGTRWKLSQQDAINAIEKGTSSFHVTKSGKTVKVIVATSKYGHKYLKTEADGEEPNNLLSLPECP